MLRTIINLVVFSIALFNISCKSVDRALHINNGFASLEQFKEGDRPEATFNMKDVFGGTLSSATRRFLKGNGHSILIEDQITLSDSTKSITWQLITAADVEITGDGAVLRQSGKELKLENLSHPDVMVSVISLDPPPLELDRRIEGLKRIEIRLPAYLFDNNEGSIRVRLSGS